MARQYAPLYTSIWQDEAFKALSSDAQRVYILALSQQNLSWCGVVPFTSRRWATFSSDSTTRKVNAAVTDLVKAGFVLVDDGTEELWVRSFIKHNVLAQPKLVQAARREFSEIHSEVIREAIATTYGWSSDTPPEGVARGSSENGESGVLGVGVKGEVSSKTTTSTNTNTNTPTAEVLAEYRAEAEREADAWLKRDPKSIISRAGWVKKRVGTLTKVYDGAPIPKTELRTIGPVCPSADCRDGYDLAGREPEPCHVCGIHLTEGRAS